MNEYFKGNRVELKNFIPSNSNRVLEIGCGEGGFRDSFSREVEYWGIEPNFEAYKVAKNNLYKIYNNTYEEVEGSIPNDYFDLIVCNDVIEHMVDHDIFFKNIKDKMKKDGRLLISVPNVRYIYNLYELIFEKDWRYRKEGILDRTHLRFFTKKSLINCVERNGYVIKSIEGVNGVNPSGLKKIIKFFLVFTGNADTLNLQFCAVLEKKYVV